MKSISNIISILLIIISLFSLSLAQSITFSEEEKSQILENGKEFYIIANYELPCQYKYLYIYTKNQNNNKAIVKIYFKQNADKNSNINYLNSDYSTIEFNSGLFIKTKDLTYKSALIYIISYETCNLLLQYKYTNEITFPSYMKYSNFQLNQFILEKGENKEITFFKDLSENEFLLILSKTSLRNIEVKASVLGRDVTANKLAYLYPNGCSLILDLLNLDDNYIDVTIKNNDMLNNQIILLGYMHHKEKEIFPIPITNGLQLYIEGNLNFLDGLPNAGNQNFDQYFTYQTYSKDLTIKFYESETRINREILSENDYNSMFHYNIKFNGLINFEFGLPNRNALYMQYLDFSDINVAQKSLQSLVTGVPKSILLPSEKSLYHFLPIERDSSNLYYYLRAKNQEKIYISFETCTSYPEGCNFEDKQNESVEAINNIGLWKTLPTKKNELQLIYVYCKNECAYDIIMTYDEDPFFLFPDNNYTKFIGDKGKDTFLLPVFEYLEVSKTESLYIDLIVLSGKADLTLKDGKDGNELKYTLTKSGNKQTYNIPSETFLSNENYFKKEIYAEIQQNGNYKNTFYNIMYGTGPKNTKILANNIMNMEQLTVPESKKESEETKTFIFENTGKKLFISIASSICSFIVDGKTDSYKYYSQVITKEGSHSLKIYLKQDSTCTSGTKENIILFAHTETSKVLISENTLINAQFDQTVSFLYLFKQNEDENNNDNSLTIEVDSLSNQKIGFNYKLEKLPIKENEEQSSADFNQTILSKNNKYISNKQIKKICGNELCGLTISFIAQDSSSSSLLGLYLNKNSLNRARNLENSFIGTANSKSPIFFYIDLNKDEDTELLINSYGQNLKYAYEEKTKDEDEDKILPLKKDYENVPKDQKISVNCKQNCRVYIGILSEKGKIENDDETTFLISYNSKKQSTTINLPLNYFTQYTFKDTKTIEYSINILEKSRVTFELYSINKEQGDKITATVKNTQVKIDSNGKQSETINPGKFTIEITTTAEGESTFIFRASTIRQSLTVDVIPVLSSYPEKCLTPPCYYLIDNFSPDTEQYSAFLYVPESEDAVISTALVDYNKDITITDITNTNKLRKYWYEYEIKDRNKKLLVKVDNVKNITLCSSFNKNPGVVTLTNGEKRSFTIIKDSIDYIVFNINNDSKKKHIINIHSIRGNGLFKYKNEIYPIGLDAAYKEDITIVIEVDEDIEIIASNEKDNTKNIDNDFAFTIGYTIDNSNQLLYPLKSDSINSFKFYKDEKLKNMFFYMGINNNQNVEMNIKIYSLTSTYDIESYIVDEDFMNKKIADSSTEPEKEKETKGIQTFIQGGDAKTGELTFSKLEISSDTVKELFNEKVKNYIYLKVNQKDSNSNKVKIDLYPYGLNKTKPLARNELYVEKLPANSLDYQLLFVKSEFDYSSDSKFVYVPPLSNKYNRAIATSNTNKNNNIRKSEDNLVRYDDLDYGKQLITLQGEKNLNKPYVLFNVLSEKGDEEPNEDFFLLSYQNQQNSEEKIYFDYKQSFNVTGTTENVTFSIFGLSPKYATGRNVWILRGYEKSKIDKLGIDKKYMALYLLFSKIEPSFSKNIILENDETKSVLKTYSEFDMKSGDYYFTSISIIEDNGREAYLAYEGEFLNVEGSKLGGLLNYMKNHIFATILIIIILILFIGCMINICRVERRKGGKGPKEKVSVDAPGRLMDDKPGE